MLWPKKKSYKEYDNEKKFLRLENSSLPPPAPITFLMVRPLQITVVWYPWEMFGCVQTSPISFVAHRQGMCIVLSISLEYI